MGFNIIIPGDKEAAISYATSDWLKTAHQAIEKKGVFNVALSGGSTPKAIFQKLAGEKAALDWSKVQVFFSDERVVPIDDPQSNFKMAWDSGFKELVSLNQMHPMYDSGDPEESAEKYENSLPSHFDMIMLGMGDDGHIASLFPQTHALTVDNRRVVANFLPQKEIWRITFTYPELEASDHTVLYVLGSEKAAVIQKVIDLHPDYTLYPVQKLMTFQKNVTLILDQGANSLLKYSP